MTNRDPSYYRLGSEWKENPQLDQKPEFSAASWRKAASPIAALRSNDNLSSLICEGASSKTPPRGSFQPFVSDDKNGDCGPRVPTVNYLPNALKCSIPLYGCSGFSISGAD